MHVVFIVYRTVSTYETISTRELEIRTDKFCPAQRGGLVSWVTHATYLRHDALNTNLSRREQDLQLQINCKLEETYKIFGANDEFTPSPLVVIACDDLHDAIMTAALKLSR